MLSKVLFIDDDSVALMLNKKLVEKAQFAEETITYVNGKEALDYFSSLLREEGEPIYPTLIFLDLNMPIMDGWEFLSEFHHSYLPYFPKTKIIVLSSSINPEDLIRSKQYPMVLDFISKPITIELLNQLELH